MVEITCDMCQKRKPASEKRLGSDSWILGYDIETEKANALQRSLRFLDRWDDARVLELGAIHLCSERCKEEYIRKARAA
jgi:putative heme degradation protein